METELKHANFNDALEDISVLPGCTTFPAEPIINLCMIAGNEAEAIVRLLTSAATAFDRLCLVSAIGEQESDGTPRAASEWCFENGKELRFAKYENKIPGIPHVDDFSAARNMSFALAGADPQDWVLWLDCDDYLDELNCRRIREAVRTVPANWDAIMCTYVLDNHSGTIMRERLMRAGKGTWNRAIHETCTVESGPYGTGECPQIQVFHSDHRKKHQSAALRNFRLLDRVLDPTPRQWFYLHAETKMLCRGSPSRPGEGEAPTRQVFAERCIHAGKVALAMLNSGDQHSADEMYQIRLNLSELEPDKTIEHLLEAIRLQPHRREALAYICQKSLNDGRLSDAVSYFRMMDALPLPAPLPFCHQGIWYPKDQATGTTVPLYHWARNYLRVRILRATGQLFEACEDHARYMQDPEYAEMTAEYEEARKKGNP